VTRQKRESTVKAKGVLRGSCVGCGAPVKRQIRGAVTAEQLKAFFAPLRCEKCQKANSAPEAAK
jgi:hypothetical protein